MANEKWLIYANELLELYNMGEEFEEYADLLSVPIPVIRQNINDMPIIDAVEVVRCKDCKRWHGDTLSCDFMPHSKYYPRPNWYADDFCSYGERKDNAR